MEIVPREAKNTPFNAIPHSCPFKLLPVLLCRSIPDSPILSLPFLRIVYLLHRRASPSGPRCGGVPVGVRPDRLSSGRSRGRGQDSHIAGQKAEAARPWVGTQSAAGIARPRGVTEDRDLESWAEK